MLCFYRESCVATIPGKWFPGVFPGCLITSQWWQEGSFSYHSYISNDLVLTMHFSHYNNISLYLVIWNFWKFYVITYSLILIKTRNLCYNMISRYDIIRTTFLTYGVKTRKVEELHRLICSLCYLNWTFTVKRKPLHKQSHLSSNHFL